MYNCDAFETKIINQKHISLYIKLRALCTKLQYNIVACFTDNEQRNHKS